MERLALLLLATISLPAWNRIHERPALAAGEVATTRTEERMRKLAAALILLATACSSAPVVEDPKAAARAAEDASRSYLLESAAADFHRHGPAPSRFRNVRYGVVEGAGGSSMPLICGEFQTADKGEEWIAFATLGTSKYEQWIGGQGKGFCERPAFGWDEDDLSAELQKRVGALK